MLLTDKDSLNSNTLSVLQDLKVKNVYLIGGSGVISTEEENSLINAGYTVKRIAGEDRYDTAVKIAEELGDSNEVAVTTGNDYADALSIGPLAAEKQIPIILVPRDNITSSIENYISSKPITKAYIIGDQDIISDNVADKFSNPIRILGADKYARNVAILNKFWTGFDHNKFCIAIGENFADALAGAVYAVKNNMAVILVKEDLTSQTKNFLQTISSSLSGITVFGGENVVPSSLLQTIMNTSSTSKDKLDFGSIYGQTYINNH
ncbi:MAG: cell wall-binding repeat-containing protein [Peptococcaceae bacterium]|nr:cell wall-binding repeat-containing protein [Peptococcaceae bacterium]